MLELLLCYIRELKNNQRFETVTKCNRGVIDVHIYQGQICIYNASSSIDNPSRLKVIVGELAAFIILGAVANG